MKPVSQFLLALSLCAVFVSPSSAANGTPKDCSTSRDPEQCLARQQAMQQVQAACKGKKGDERKSCMREHMPKPDCSKAKDVGRCEQRRAASEVCKTMFGAEHKSCMKNELRKPSSRPAANPRR